MRKHTAIILGSLAAALAVIGLAVGRAKPEPLASGIKVGGRLGSFRPRHATGADRGTDVCPLCQYPTNPAVQVWVNGDDDRNIAAIASSLEQSAVAHKAGKLKAFLVYYHVPNNSDPALHKQFEGFAAKHHLKNVAIVFVHSTDLNAFRDNAINTDPRVKNTVFVYKASVVSAKFVNLTGDQHGIDSLQTAIAQVVQ